MTNFISKKYFLILLLIVLAGLFLRVYPFEAKSWIGEVDTGIVRQALDLGQGIIEKDYSAIVKEGKEFITCGGRNKENAFLIKASIVDFRQYSYCTGYASIKWSNFILEITGEALIDGDTMQLTGRGVAERTPMCYWWL